MVSIAILRKFSREGMLKYAILGAKFELPYGAKVIETSTHVRLGVCGGIGVLMEDKQLAALAWGLGYEEAYGPDSVAVTEINISSDEFSIRLYEGMEREPWAEVRYPVGAIKTVPMLIKPLERDTNEEWKRHYYRVCVLVKGREVGPIIFVGKDGAGLIWPEGIDIMEALSRVEEPQADNEAPKWLEEAVERWARELGVIE